MSKAHGRYDETSGYDWATVPQSHGELGGEWPVGKYRPYEKLSADLFPHAGQTLGQALLFLTINNMVVSGGIKWVVGLPGWEQNWG